MVFLVFVWKDTNLVEKVFVLERKQWRTQKLGLERGVEIFINYKIINQEKKHEKLYTYV